LFGEEEEEIIGEFLVSCWKKNLQVPNDTLFETLKKHLHIYPRSSQSRSNKPSPAWFVTSWCDNFQSSWYTCLVG